VNFLKRKLDESHKDSLKLMMWEEVKAYTILPAPLYCYLPQNHKYIAVKGPLDFFTTEEKDKFKKAQTFFYTSWIDKIIPIQNCALELKENFAELNVIKKMIQEKYSPVEIGDPGFLKSKETLKKISFLWNSDLTIEPYFVLIFCESLLGGFDAERLENGRSKHIDIFEHGLMYSALGVFLMLHYGCMDLHYLKELRELLFDYKVFDKKIDFNSYQIEFIEFCELLERVYPDSNIMVLSDDVFLNYTSRFAQKLISRLSYRADQFIDSKKSRLSIFDQGGFLDEKV